jgi:hypothetical protein
LAAKPQLRYSDNEVGLCFLTLLNHGLALRKDTGDQISERKNEDNKRLLITRKDWKTKSRILSKTEQKKQAQNITPY